MQGGDFDVSDNSGLSSKNVLMIMIVMKVILGRILLVRKSINLCVLSEGMP